MKTLIIVAVTLIASVVIHSQAPSSIPVEIDNGLTKTFVQLALPIATAPRAKPAATLVKVEDNLQAALDKAKPGDTLTLEAGAVFKGNFVLSKKDGSAYITITTSRLSSLPPNGQRVTPTDGLSMPKIVSSNGPVITTLAGAHHYRFVGVEIATANPGVYSTSPRVVIGSSAKTEADLPYNIEFDRVYIHGDPIAGSKRGIEINGKAIVVKNSWISDIMARGQEAQAICGWNTPGPLEITNNYLAASGMSVLIGGAEPSIVGVHPSNITIARNYMTKPLAWRDDKSLTVKNLLEMKAGRRVNITGNIFENVWVSAQTGYAILFKPGITTITPTLTTDVLFENNIVRHAAGGINIVGTNHNGGVASNLTIRNNLFEDIGGTAWGGPMPFLALLLAPARVRFENNTATGTVTPTSMAAVDGPPAPGFVFQGNIFPYGAYGIKGSGAAGGNPTLERFFPDAVFTKNVLFGTKGNPAIYPEGNYFPLLASQIGWEDMTAGHYKLAPSSRYFTTGVNGQNPGVNLQAIVMATATTLSGRQP